MKKCNCCNLKKEFSFFHKDNSRKDGLSYICKECRKNKSKKWLEKNKKEYYQKRKGKYNQYYKDRYDRLTPEQKQKKREYLSEWEKNNRDKVNKYKAKQRQKLYFRLKENIRTRMYQFLKGKKDKSMEELLGCSVEFYYKYLEAQFTPEMTWGNYGSYWEIDHIEMISKFNINNLAEQRRAFIYTNTRPMVISDNRSKKYNL